MSKEIRKGNGEAEGWDSKAAHWESTLSPLSPQKVRCSEMSPCLGTVQLLNKDSDPNVTEDYRHFIHKVL